MPKTKTEKPISKARKSKKPAKKKKTKKKEKNTRSPRFFKFTGLDGKTHSLTKQQKDFVEYYLTWGGNGVDAVIEAGYKCEYSRGGTNRKLAAVISSQNLIKLNIVAYVNLKLEEYGFNDNSVEKQHLFLLNQHADFTNKKGAIDMYYKLKGKYAPIESKVTVKSKLEELTPEELAEVIATGKLPGGLNE